jgi:hypothetical protein
MRGLPLLSRLAVLAVLAVAAACGSDSPSSSSSGSVRVQGVVLGMGSASGEVTASDAVKASGSTVTVTVEGTSVTTTVSANGTFELEGIPSGTFTLVFTKDGVEIGRVAITATEGAEVKIVVQVQSTTIIVIELEVEDRDDEDDGGSSTSPSACVISGGRVGSSIELEGTVASGNSSSFTMKVDGERSSADVSILTSGSTSFKCNGGAKLGDAECKATVKSGAKVHVSGQLKTCSSASAQVTAGEVKVQKGAGDGDDD